MAHDDKELAEIKGYVSRLYTLVRSRTEISLELSEDQKVTIPTSQIVAITNPSDKVSELYDGEKEKEDNE